MPPKTTASPRRSVRDAQKELTRELFLEAARSTFEEKGYVSVTVDEIVQRVGAARGTFYLYFDSKAAVFEAVVEKLELRQQYQKLLAQLAAIDAPTVDALQAWFEDYVDLYQENRAILGAIHEARAVEPAITKIVLEYLNEAVGRWPMPGFVNDGDSARLRLTALVGYVLAEGIMNLWLVQGLELDRHLTTRVLAEQFLAALQGAEPRKPAARWRRR
jgi:AcrR family transcriptional regulator